MGHYIQVGEMLSTEQQEEDGWTCRAAFGTAVMVRMEKLPIQALQSVR